MNFFQFFNFFFNFSIFLTFFSLGYFLNQRTNVCKNISPVSMVYHWSDSKLPERVVLLANEGIDE